MGANSKIEWTDHTFNPWIGCTKVAAGCEHCYAEALAKRTGTAKWGGGGTRIKTSAKNWGLSLKWNAEAAAAGERRRVFCASLADVFEEWPGAIHDHHRQMLFRLLHGSHLSADDVPANREMFAERGIPALTLDDLRRELFKLVDSTLYLDWLLLTKRPGNIVRMWADGGADAPNHQAHSDGRDNVWLGTSIARREDLKNLDELRDCRDLVPVLFLSIEPLLEDLGAINLRGIDWVIVGGESGPDARPLHPDWVRSLRNQCQAANVPFFFKQWGEWIPEGQVDSAPEGTQAKFDTVEHRGEPWPVFRCGKKLAGRLLDGREWDEFPQLREVSA